MNIGYIYIGNLKIGSGVHKKIKEQVRQWRELGNNVRIFHFPVDKINSFVDDEEGVFEPITNILFYKINCFREIMEFSDIIYMRYNFISLDAYRLISHIPTVVEINSDEIAEYKLERFNGWKKTIKYYLNKINRLLFMSKVVGKVCVTEELKEKEMQFNANIPTIALPNPLYSIDNRMSGEIHLGKIIPQLVFIGSPGQPWHGIDKIIQLATATVGKLDINIIGMEKPVMSVPENIHFCGYLSKEQYDKYLQEADVGIGTLALHRKHMNEACPLKIREYLAYGLPIIIGYKDTAFLNIGKKEWLLELPNIESNVMDAVDDIVAFANKVKGYKVNPDEVEFMSSRKIEEQRIEFFSKFL